MCARFIAALDTEVWTAYAETCGWDILLVRKEDGLQIGIEAKLKFNARVLNQALEEYGCWSADRAGPDCRAVMVPAYENCDLGRLAHYVGVTVISVSAKSGRFDRPFWPELPGVKFSWEDWHETGTVRRHTLPDYVPDVAAGAPAPLQLTPWKIGALRLEAILESRGYVTRADFKHLRVDHRRWIAPGVEWLRVEGKRYVKGRRFPNFKAQHVRVFAEIVADKEKWMPPDPELLSGQQNQHASA